MSIVGGQVVRADVRRDDVEVVVERARAGLHREGVARPMRERGAVDDLRAVHRESARVLRIGALVGHHDPEPPDLGVGHRVEGVERRAVELDPAVVHVVRRDRVLDRQQRHELVVAQHHLAVGVKHEADVEEAAGELGMARLRLRHHEHAPLARQAPELVGLGPGNVDRALAREGLVVEVEHLVVEALQRALRDRDQPHRQVEAAQPRRRGHEVVEMLEVAADLVAVADAPHRRNQPDRLIRLDHLRLPSRWAVLCCLRQPRSGVKASSTPSRRGRHRAMTPKCWV